MQIEWCDIDKIRPYANNPRKNDEAVDAVAASLRAFGWQQPLVVNEGYELIVGETRWKAAQRLGMKEVPVHVATGLSPEQIRAYRLADNKTHEFSVWDEERLIQELMELEKVSFDFGPVGFSRDELQVRLKSDGGIADPDFVPEPSAGDLTRPGDVWVLGDHRLACADPADPQAVNRLVDGTAVDLANFDLPRVEDLDPEFGRLLLAWFGNVSRVLRAGGCIYCWGRPDRIADYLVALCQSDLHFEQPIVWPSEHAAPANKDFRAGYELCCYGWKCGAPHFFGGPKRVSDVWSVGSASAEKPVEVAVRALRCSSRPGECVLDLFGGTGWTLLAAEQTGRRALVMENDPRNCDVIIRRWESYTGRKAVRAE